MPPGNCSQPNIFHHVGLILLAIISINTFYLRGYDLPIPYLSSASYLIPILNVICFIYLVIVFSKSSKLIFPKQETILVSLLIFFVSVSILYNLLMISGGSSSVQFSVEIYMNIYLFVSSFILARYVKTQHILNVILITGVFFSFVILYIGFFEVEEIRRVGNTELPIGVNHLSHALVVSFTIGLCRLYFQSKNRVLTSSIIAVIFVATFLTGSRSGFLALVVVMAFFMTLYRWDFVRNGLVILVVGVTPIIGITLSVFDFTIDGGLGRVNRDRLASSLLQRIERYVDVIKIIFSDLTNMLVGAGMNNYTVVSSDVIIQSPHNIWLSFALFFGVPASLAFFLLHLSILANGIKTVLSGTGMKETTIALVLCLIVVSIYAFFSGRITRIFTIWVIMGLLSEHIYDVRISKDN